MTIEDLKGFRTSFGRDIFYNKYAQGPDDTWAALADRLVDDVCGSNGRDFLVPVLTDAEIKELKQYITEFKFVPGGRYLYYAGRANHYWNNCFLLKGEEDTREEWSDLTKRAMSCLMTGGGIGIDYSVFREEGSLIKRTGGTASGPISLMKVINEVGRYVKQGGSRRSALYASLNWRHKDAKKFLHAKDWDDFTREQKEKDFNYPAPLDMTNISLNWDDEFLKLRDMGQLPDLWYESVRQMVKTAEPGHSYNFGDKANSTLRNACTEVDSEDDSDVCNLASVNMARVLSKEEFQRICYLGSKFLVCGTLRADLPYEKVRQVRAKNRRLGLGLMGMHEWLLKRGERYEVTKEMKQWLAAYQYFSESGANQLCDRLGINRPVAYRAIAPTGTIGILAGTTTGIEPMFAVALKRRYLEGNDWKFQYVIDATAQTIIDLTGCDPDSIETSYSLARNPERRIAFQADVQDYVDMSISSTLNLPAWGSSYNNEHTYRHFAELLARYAHRLRGFTCYPDGARGGQPLTEVPYSEAVGMTGVTFTEFEEGKCKGDVCGI